MLSYLNGMRPNSRRSAVPPVTSTQHAYSSRHYHESTLPSSSIPDLPPPRSFQPNGLSEASSVSLDPPILPPIPRVASRQATQISEREDHYGYEDTFMSTKEPKRAQREPSPRRAPPAPNNDYRPQTSESDRHRQAPRSLKMPPPPPPPEQLHPGTAKPRRPIDVKYESMRSYSEPPFRQSMMPPPSNFQISPEPYRQPHPPPLPPPKPPHPALRHQSRPQTQPQPQRQAPHSSSQSVLSQPLSQNLQPNHLYTQIKSDTQAPPVKLPQSTPAASSQSRHGKAKLNLLNPISLLARRRSSQAVAEAYSQTQNPPGMRLPDADDFTFRGNVVHDFSAPRPGRGPSCGDAAPYQVRSREERKSDIDLRKRSPNPNSASAPEDDSPNSSEREHAPVFKEHFDESLRIEQDGSAKRRSAAFMYQVSLQESQPNPDPSTLPAFARKLPTDVSTTVNTVHKTSSPPPMPLLEAVPESANLAIMAPQSSSPTSPPAARSRATSITDSPLQGLGSPKRFKSNASRFSFDLAGVGSAAQEKLLEDKHRQKTKGKGRDSVMSFEDGLYDEEDDDQYLDYDDMDDDGLEEKIPGVNADDYENEDTRLPVSQQTIENLTFISPNKSSFESVTSPVSTGLTSPGTPRDIQGQPVGFAGSKLSPNSAQVQTGDSQASSNSGNVSRPRSTPGGNSNSGLHANPLQRVVSSDTALAGLPHRQGYQDDDLYFDDGMIEELGDDRCQAFDESVFDDDSNMVYGLPIRDRKLKPSGDASAHHHVEIDEQQPSGTLASRSSITRGIEGSGSTSHQSLGSDGITAELRDALTELNQPSRTNFSQTAGLTHDNLAAYDNSALARAAYQAALNGAFDRSNSQRSIPSIYSDMDPAPEPARNESHMSRKFDGLPHFEDDDADSDDDIVAAANAEALENDDDGFYGQEFGFFARSSGSSETEYANGGYFGARALEGIHRSHGGRDAFQEPSLTPITERSEWSNRNSNISLAMHGHGLSASGLSDPQLSNMMHVPEEGMMLEALMRLRRSAWGGSSASLHSSSNSQNSGSPMTYMPPGTMVSPTLQKTSSTSNMAGSSHNLTGSFHSFSSNDSDPSPTNDSPTIIFSPAQSGLTMAHEAPMRSPPPPPVPPHQGVSPVTRSAMLSKSNWAPGHSRGSSGAESVSYIEEGGKWVLEKRRIGEGGEVEILRRSVVEGGRI